MEDGGGRERRVGLYVEPRGKFDDQKGTVITVIYS
jgi:hypothetical protein